MAQSFVKTLKLAVKAPIKRLFPKLFINYLGYTNMIGETRSMTSALRVGYFLLGYPLYWHRLGSSLTYLEMPLTTRCTLRCAKCANLMQYYEGPGCRDIPVAQILGQLDALFAVVKHITMFRILGGEPLLYAELAAVLRRVLAEPGVDAVQIVTNGTLLPSEELIELLKNPKLSVQISDYGPRSCHRDELAAQIEQQGGKVEIWHAQGMWRDMGGLECRGRTTEELTQQLITCGSNCYSFFNGRINRCPRVSHGMDLGAIPDMPGDYVDMMAEGTSTKEKQRAIRNLMTSEKIGTCNYCDAGTERCVPTPTAEQMTKRAAE